VCRIDEKRGESDGEEERWVKRSDGGIRGQNSGRVELVFQWKEIALDGSPLDKKKIVNRDRTREQTRHYSFTVIS